MILGVRFDLVLTAFPEFFGHFCKDIQYTLMFCGGALMEHFFETLKLHGGFLSNQ